MARFTLDFVSKHLARKVEADLIIPSYSLHDTLSSKTKDMYQKRDTKFPLIIFLCGFGDNKLAWLRNTAVEELCEKHHVAGLFIDGENKWYLNQGPIEDHYNLIEEDFLDFLYGNFTNLDKSAPLVIAGVSMGGYGALYHYLTNVDKYSACIAMSPATKPDFIDESKYGTLKDHFLKNKDKKLNVYLSIGENDFIIGASKEFNNFLKKANTGVEYKFVPKRDHSWTLWREEIFNAFDYLINLGIIGK